MQRIVFIACVAAGGGAFSPLAGAAGQQPAPAAVDDPVVGVQTEPSADDHLEFDIDEVYHQADWGIAVAMRIASIPFTGVNDTVSSFVPMLFYEGDHFFMRGTSGGVHLWKDGMREVNALARLRFFDIPAEFQNTVQGDTADFGLQFHDGVGQSWWEAEVMSDSGGNLHGNLRAGASALTDRWVVEPALNLRLGSKDFVSRYFALESLTGNSADASMIVSPEVTARFHLISDLYLIGGARYNVFGKEIRDLPTIDDSGSFETFIGFGFFQDRGTPQYLGRPNERVFDDRNTELVPFVRLAHGWGTSSSLADIFNFDIEDDEFNNQMTPVFYGYPLTDSLFGLPLDVFISPGIARHWSSEVQDPTFELIVKIHLYYTINWPFRWRVGVAEGLSWIEETPYLERVDLEEKGYRPSQLMNYLDFTLDVNVGDVFGAESLRPLWFGASIHHRSSIFESASQFGRIKGGSNYPSIYLQWDIH